MQFGHRRGPTVLALEYARSRATIAICPEILIEVRRTLVVKFGWESSAVEYRLSVLLAKSISVAVKGNVHVCRDPNDDMVLECAIMAGAKLIVSGDKDLLVIGKYEGIQILTPAEYLAQSE
jgi:putative PIN family toxin of toxin-antitoxin system